MGLTLKIISWNVNGLISFVENKSYREIEKIDASVSSAIESFRNKSLKIIPGGGGKYGHVSFNDELKKKKVAKVTTLDNF